MRQVDVTEPRLELLGTHHSRVDDPGCGLDVGQRAPEVHQGKVPDAVAEFSVQLSRHSVAPQRLRPVRVVDRSGGADVVGFCSLAVQREPDRRGQCGIVLFESLPDLGSLDALVPGGPHLDFALVAIVEAVSDHAMLLGTNTSRHVGLHRAGHRGKPGDSGTVAPWLISPVKRGM